MNVGVIRRVSMGNPVALELPNTIRSYVKSKSCGGCTESLKDSFVECLNELRDRLGVTGENLLSLLERRLDNVVYRLGFGSSRKQARQIINHGHILVNGRKTDIPSYTVSEGDVIEVRPRSRELIAIQSSLATAEGKDLVNWLDIDRTAFKGQVRALPSKEDIEVPVHEQIVVELYSR